MSSAALAGGPPPMSTVPGALRLRPALVVALLTLASAVLRVATADLQSFWLDETVSVRVVSLGFEDMVGRLPTETSPPLFYLVGWGWGRVFGFGEVGMRSLSVVALTATIPMLYALVARLATPRAGLFAAALAACNPMLFYYAQEARPYGIVVLLSTASLLCLLRARERPTPGRLLTWVAVCALGLLAHYFTAFLVAPEALILLVDPGPRRNRWMSVVGVASVGAALAPLAAVQRARGGTDWITDTSLPLRVAEVPKQFLVGLDGPDERVAAGVALILVLVGVAALAVRGTAHERRGGVLLAGLAAATLLVPVLLALGGLDVLNARNVLPAWPALAGVAAIGFATRRARGVATAAGIGLCALSLVVTTAVVTDARYQRDDWRGLAKALSASTGPRLVVLTPEVGSGPLSFYSPGLRPVPRPPGPVTEIDVVALGSRAPGRPIAVPAPPTRPPASGFALVGRERGPTFAFARFRSPSARSLSEATIRAAAFGAGPPTLLAGSGSTSDVKGR